MTGQVWIWEFVVDIGRTIVYTSYYPTENISANISKALNDVIIY
jgi:hypothetical protein